MIKINATFGHYFLQVSVGDAVAHVEKHVIQYHTLGELVPFEINHHNGNIACSLFGKRIAKFWRQGNSEQTLRQNPMNWLKCPEDGCSGP
jgi:hypothetical protein